MLKDGSKQAIIGYGQMMSLDCLILFMTNNQISCWNKKIGEKMGV